MTETCVHHWIIDSNNIGRCKKCPAVKDFNRLQHRHEYSDSLRRKSAAGGRAFAEKHKEEVRNEIGAS